MRKSKPRDKPIRPMRTEEDDQVNSGNAVDVEEVEEVIDGEGRDEALPEPEEKSDSEDRGDEGQVPKQLTNTRGPTRREREEHELTHIPYRSWCAQCVHGRGRNTAHKKMQEEERQEEMDRVSKIYIDFYWNGSKSDADPDKEEEDSESPAIVMYDGRTKAIASWLLEGKSVGPGEPSEWIIDAMVQELEGWGYTNRKIILVSDGEAAILVIKKAIARRRRAETIPEESPVGEHQANIAEGAVRRAREQTRVLLSNLDIKCGEKAVKRDCDAMKWMVRWAAALVSRYQIGSDGQTAHERIKGRKCRGPIAIFGESVWYKEMNDNKGDKAKIESRWHDGVWMGVKGRTGEYIVGTSVGVVKAHTVRRKPEDMRWNADEINAVVGTPHQPKPGRNDSRIPVRIRAPAMEEPIAAPPELDFKPRRVNIQRRDYQRHGYTDGCAGCDAMATGTAKRPHNPRCIERMMDELAKTDEGKERIRKGEERITAELARRVEELDGARMIDEQMADPIPDAARENMADAAQDDAQMDADDIMMGRVHKERGLYLLIKDGVGMLARMNPCATQSDVDVTEVFSPKRVVEIAEKHGLTGGLSMDLLTGWDFSKQEDCELCELYVRTVKPKLVIGSPVCTPFSQLQGLNWGKSEERDRKMRDELRKGIKYMIFVLKLYRIQDEEGRYYLHEHPAGAKSWKMPEVQKFMADTDAMTVTAHQCELGLRSRDRFGEAPAKKPTTFMSNSILICERLDVQCTNMWKPEKERHRHVHLMNGRASAAQTYPLELCTAIVEGLKDQLRMDACRTVKALTISDTRKVGREHTKLMRCAKEVVATKVIPEPFAPAHEEDENDIAIDDVSGAQLDANLVKQARLEEMAYFHKMGVYTKVSRRSVPVNAKITKVRWIDINKGDEENPQMRSRLVAKEFKDTNSPELFAGTPPTEALRMLCSLAATKNEKGEYRSMMCNDVSRAYFYAKVRKDMWIELPPEDVAKGEEGLVGKLNLSMYGTREAASNWQDEVGMHMRSIGFIQGRASNCLYVHETRDISSLVHGDDYVSAGAPSDLDWMKQELEKKFEIKTKIIGPRSNENKEMKVLNRVIRVVEDGWEYEGDQRHGEIIVRETGMKSAKPVSTAGEDEPKKEDQEEELKENGKRWYRGITARAN